MERDRDVLICVDHDHIIGPRSSQIRPSIPDFNRNILRKIKILPREIYYFLIDLHAL